MTTPFDQEVEEEEEEQEAGLRFPPLSWVLFVIALASAVTFFFLWQGAKGDERRRQDVKAAATTFLVALTNFEGSTIDQDVAEIRALAVGDFADQVDQFFDDETMDALRQANARSVGVVQDVFVQSLEGGTASAFGVVSESVTNSASTTPRTELVRIDLDLIETTEGWRVARVAILQSSGQPTLPTGPTPSPSPTPSPGSTVTPEPTETPEPAESPTP